jgi:hypothetical protein
VAETEEFKSLRRLALASLGRNVLHFQRVKTQLERLVLICDFAAPGSEFHARFADRAAELRTTTMGSLAKELHASLYGTPAEPEVEESITELFVQIGLRIKADPDYVTQQKKRLSDLVVERDNLIHQDLASFDPSSAESCRQWITRLDKQDERIVALHKELQQLLYLHSEAAKQILVAVESDELRLGLKPGCGDVRA